MKCYTKLFAIALICLGIELTYGDVIPNESQPAEIVPPANDSLTTKQETPNQAGNLNPPTNSPGKARRLTIRRVKKKKTPVNTPGQVQGSDQVESNIPTENDSTGENDLTIGTPHQAKEENKSNQDETKHNLGQGNTDNTLIEKENKSGSPIHTEKAPRQAIEENKENPSEPIQNSEQINYHNKPKQVGQQTEENYSGPVQNSDTVNTHNAPQQVGKQIEANTSGPVKNSDPINAHNAPTSIKDKTDQPAQELINANPPSKPDQIKTDNWSTQTEKEPTETTQKENKRQQVEESTKSNVPGSVQDLGPVDTRMTTENELGDFQKKDAKESAVETDLKMTEFQNDLYTISSNPALKSEVQGTIIDVVQALGPKNPLSNVFENILNALDREADAKNDAELLEDITNTVNQFKNILTLGPLGSLGEHRGQVASNRFETGEAFQKPIRRTTHFDYRDPRFENRMNPFNDVAESFMDIGHRIREFDHRWDRIFDPRWNNYFNYYGY